jgi:hypothetical protein
MSRYKTIYTEVEVDVDMSEFETDELIEELDRRGRDYIDADEMRVLLESIWHKRRVGNNDYQQELDRLIYAVLGKVI